MAKPMPVRLIRFADTPQMVYESWRETPQYTNKKVVKLNVHCSHDIKTHLQFQTLASMERFIQQMQEHLKKLRAPEGPTMPAILFLPTLGIQELLVILAIAVLIFGGRKIPELAKGVGEGLRSFRTALKDTKETTEETKAEMEK